MFVGAGPYNRRMAKRRRLTVDVGNDLETWVLHQVEAGGFGTPSEYIRHLLQSARAASSVDQIDARLIASEESGPARRTNPGDWKALAKRGDARVAALLRGTRKSGPRSRRKTA